MTTNARTILDYNFNRILRQAQKNESTQQSFYHSYTPIETYAYSLFTFSTQPLHFVESVQKITQNPSNNPPNE